MQDLDILDSREKIPFTVRCGPPASCTQDTIIPFWQGKTMRELIFAEMTAEWIAAYEAGIFTEFMEQRSPGHTVLDDKIYHKGMLDFKHEIETALARLDFLNDPQAYAKQEELKAMRICADGSDPLCASATPKKPANWLQQRAEPAAQSRAGAASPRSAPGCPRTPRATFWEALQYYWFVHLGVTTELNTWDAFNPGQLDQHLYPFYQQGLETAH